MIQSVGKTINSISLYNLYAIIWHKLYILPSICPEGHINYKIYLYAIQYYWITKNELSSHKTWINFNHTVQNEKKVLKEPMAYNSKGMAVWEAVTDQWYSEVHGGVGGKEHSWAHGVLCSDHTVLYNAVTADMGYLSSPTLIIRLYVSF